MADRGVKVIISGGMGGGAIDIFNERDVEVIVGASGVARSAVESYLRGELSLPVPFATSILIMMSAENKKYF